MFISKKKHKDIVDGLKSTIGGKQHEIETLKERIGHYDFTSSLDNKVSSLSRSLDALDARFYNMHESCIDVDFFCDDYFTGKKIIKENGNKVIKIDKEGEVTYHLSERDTDDRCDYILDRNYDCIYGCDTK